MSGQRSFAPEGVELALEDGQRWMDDAAAMDDRVTEMLMLPGALAAAKAVTPLLDDNLANAIDARLLLIPSSGGKLYVRPAWYARGTPDPALVAAGSGVPEMTLSKGILSRTETSSAIPANNSGSTKYHGIYAVLARAVTVSESRLKRDANDVETNQPVTLADRPAITVGFTSAEATRAAARDAEPADTSTAFTFHLGFVVTLNGYASGGSIDQSSGGAASAHIEQGYTSGWIRPGRVLGMRQASLMGSGGTGDPYGSTTGSPLARLGAFHRFMAAVKLGNSSTSYLLDNSIEWRRRWIRVEGTLCDTQSGSTYPDPTQVTVAGSKNVFDPKSGFTGTDGATAVSRSSFGQAGNVSFSFFADVTGLNLTVALNGDAMWSSTDNTWLFVIECSDRFIIGA